MFSCKWHWGVTFLFIFIGRLIILLLNYSYNPSNNPSDNPSNNPSDNPYDKYKLCSWLFLIDVIGLSILWRYIFSLCKIHNYETMECIFGKNENINQRFKELKNTYCDIIVASRFDFIYQIINVIYLLFNFPDFMQMTSNNWILYTSEIFYCLCVVIYELKVLTIQSNESLVKPNEDDSKDALLSDPVTLV